MLDLAVICKSGQITNHAILNFELDWLGKWTALRPRDRPLERDLELLSLLGGREGGGAGGSFAGGAWLLLRATSSLRALLLGLAAGCSGHTTGGGRLRFSST